MAKRFHWQDLGLPFKVLVKSFSFTPDTATLLLELPNGETINVSVSPGESTDKLGEMFSEAFDAMLSEPPDVA